MTVVIVVAVVIAKHPTVLEPELLFKNRALALAFETVFLDFRRSNRRLDSSHKTILAQEGCQESCLFFLALGWRFRLDHTKTMRSLT